MQIFLPSCCFGPEDGSSRFLKDIGTDDSICFEICYLGCLAVQGNIGRVHCCNAFFTMYHRHN
jgi:hypothetical protein